MLHRLGEPATRGEGGRGCGAGVMGVVYAGEQKGADQLGGWWDRGWRRREGGDCSSRLLRQEQGLARRAHRHQSQAHAPTGSARCIAPCQLGAVRSPLLLERRISLLLLFSTQVQIDVCRLGRFTRNGKQGRAGGRGRGRPAQRSAAGLHRLPLPSSRGRPTAGKPPGLQAHPQLLHSLAPTASSAAHATPGTCPRSALQPPCAPPAAPPSELSQPPAAASACRRCCRQEGTHGRGSVIKRAQQCTPCRCPGRAAAAAAAALSARAWRPARLRSHPTLKPSAPTGALSGSSDKS